MDTNLNITLRVIDGTDKGREYEKIPFPVTLGRESQNTIQLHDEKVSRYHCKIQCDRGEVFLTDIDSTNGTQINGQPVTTALLHPGDLISLGQTLIIVGSRDEIIRRLALLDELDLDDAALRMIVVDDALDFLPSELVKEMECYSYDVQDALRRLHSVQPPSLPQDLLPSQVARLSEMLLYFQIRLKMLIEKARLNETTNRVSLNQREWQSLLDIFARITDYGNSLTKPYE